MVGVDENMYSIGSYILLYPNPSTGTMTLDLQGKADFGTAVVTVTDLTGKAIKRFEWRGETTTLDLSGLSKGVYFVEINASGNTEVRKVMIQ